MSEVKELTIEHLIKIRNRFSKEMLQRSLNIFELNGVKYSTTEKIWKKFAKEELERVEQETVAHYTVVKKFNIHNPNTVTLEIDTLRPIREEFYHELGELILKHTKQ